MDRTSPHYIAHRIQGFGHPENSIAALRAALDSHADEIELDLRRTGDGRFVASHWPTAFGSKEGLLELDTVLALYRAQNAGKGLRLDLKTSGSEATLVSAVRDAGMIDYTTFMSRNPRTLARIRKADSNAKLSRTIVVTGLGDWLDWPLYRLRAKTGAALRKDGKLSITLAKLFGSYSPRIVTDALSSATEVVVCVTSNAEIERLRTWGVRSFLSNKAISSAA